MSNKTTVVVERRGHGYECGIESGNTTECGAWGETSQAAIARALLFRAEGAVNLSQAVSKDVEVLAALVQALCNQLNIDLENAPRTVYEVAKEFGGGQIAQLKAELGRIKKVLSDLDRCVHGRHQGDYCCYCEEPSPGNPFHDAPVGFALDGRALSVADLFVLLKTP